MEEEIELFSEIEEQIEKNEENESLTINGDVYISINNNTGKVNLRKIRSKLTKPLKQKIKQRDSKTCLCCEKKFENHLEVHHIMPVSQYPDLATVPENLASLCQQCHAKYHEMYRHNEGAVSFALFLKHYGK